MRIQLAARGTQGLQAHPAPPSHLPARLLQAPQPKGPPRCQPGTGSTDFPPGSPHSSVPTAPCHFPIPGAEGEVPDVPAGSTRTWLTPGAGSTARFTPALLTLWRGRNPQNPIPQPRDCRQQAASRGDPPAFTPDTIFPPGITLSPPQMPSVPVPSTTTPPVGDRGGQGGDRGQLWGTAGAARQPPSRSCWQQGRGAFSGDKGRLCAHAAAWPSAGHGSCHPRQIQTQPGPCPDLIPTQTVRRAALGAGY